MTLRYIWRLLQPRLSFPTHLLHDNLNSEAEIEKYYGDIVSALLQSGDLSSVENYRPITLSPIISKIFESVLLIKYGMYLNVNDRQFGFRNGLGCNNAIFVLRNVIEYFNERESNVYLTSWF